ncbi:50S ribosomal subunit-associated GTPase HflX [Paraburkholderia sp. HC6.4b]|nr:50S ribosomal subunit-associated GTPase HflX [Paraburkholderia sp. HC6.4b]MBB5451102.1 50S ribosomal subunit-associated GTPase HflX [Paraburkholderia sp. Kb1A]
MGLQREVRTGFRSPGEIEREVRRERIDALLSHLEAEIHQMNGQGDEYSSAALRELEARLRQLADRAQVAGSAPTTPSL